MNQKRWITAGLPLTAFGLVLTLFACSGDIPSSPGDPAPPSHAIQDALNGGGGNPFVFLKPPVVYEPDPALFGTFNPDLHPVIEVCELVSDDVCTILTTNDGTHTEARYTVDGGPGGETVTVDLSEEEYQVQIHFSLFDLQDNSTYRILTRVGAKTLAYADVILVSPKEMKNSDSENNIVFTNDSKTVPWKIRIDNGALCWEPGDVPLTCEAGTVTAGEEETITLTSSDGEEVDFHLPAGWTATVDGQTVDNLTISIEELPADNDRDGEFSCFANFLLSDPDTGEPSNCYDVRADTETETDVTVVFGGTLPILSFCPDQEVLQAIANGTDGYVMTSVEDDTQNAVRRTYANVQPPADFGGCALPPPQVSFGDGPVGQFAGMVWDRIRPVMKPLLPTPLYAADLGFGGEVRTLSTIFFWGRTPEAITVTPSSTSVDEGQTVPLSAAPAYHDGVTTGSAVAVEWSSSDAAVATVDGSGVVTGVAAGTAQILATSTDVLDPFGSFLSGSATVTVEPATTGTASISGQVTDGASQPITGVSVLVQGTTTATLTDANGQYSLLAVQVGTGTVTLEVSVVGYDSQTQTINVQSGGSYTVNFQLTATTTVAGGFGTATIDGVSGQGEWDNAACFPVAMNLPGGSNTNGEFCFMNDGTNMYVRSAYTNTADPTDPASTLFFVLDMNGNSVVSGYNPGDDGLAQQQSNGSLLPFRDEAAFDENTFVGVSCPVGSTCSSDDDVIDPQLGTIDGSGGYTNVNGAVTFEMSHPLNSGDVTVNNEPLDVSLAAGQSILVRYLQTVHQDTQLNGTASTGHTVEVQIYAPPIN